MLHDTPVQRVLGFWPHIPATVKGSDQRLRVQAAASYSTSSLSRILERRQEEMIVFLEDD